MCHLDRLCVCCACPAATSRPQALDCTLPPDHPYHQACGLRAGSAASLVSLEFCSFPPSSPHPKVPPGLQYYNLQAQLSGERTLQQAWLI